MGALNLLFSALSTIAESSTTNKDIIRKAKQAGRDDIVEAFEERESKRKEICKTLERKSKE